MYPSRVRFSWSVELENQLIMEFFDKDDPAGGWVHISYNESGSNRKQVLTFDGKKYTEGLPEMKWKDGQVV